MLAATLGILALVVGFLFYSHTQKSGRELELRRIQTQIDRAARRKDGREAGRLVPAPARKRG
ncbi:MAG: hypothetical protein ACK4MQ_12645 [Hyphomonas sp.]